MSFRELNRKELHPVLCRGSHDSGVNKRKEYRFDIRFLSCRDTLSTWWLRTHSLVIFSSSSSNHHRRRVVEMRIVPLAPSFDRTFQFTIEDPRWGVSIVMQLKLSNFSENHTQSRGCWWRWGHDSTFEDALNTLPTCIVRYTHTLYSLI